MTVSIGLGWFGSNFFLLAVGWVGLGQSPDGLDWIGSHKMDNPGLHTLQLHHFDLLYAFDLLHNFKSSQVAFNE